MPQQNVPPAGSIWFGTSFDPTSFAITGQATSFASGSQIAAVAHLTKQGAGHVVIYLTAGSTRLPEGSGDLSGSNDLLADVLNGLGALPAGTYSITVEDQGGNTLSSGSLTIT